MSPAITREAAWAAAATVTDPEIPVLTIADLGILRDVTVTEGAGGPEGADGTAGPPCVTVTITPTYSGCPAMGQITADVTAALRATGAGTVRVETTLSPAWTTDWMTEDGKRKLEEYGIAPPTRRSTDGPVPLTLGVPGGLPGLPGIPGPDRPRCPHCHSADTREMTRFSSTSCKALHVCNDCHEPFDYFKVH
ncbi:1,2-phenylacetyl-CoA epoxidase subunit PaaD [uncultured Corynebacterium sp.]|uniref:1,2-phenylacetyl-CoA epoxidase subunit PaaD n=1 Tax=uncultured Corynebacterium sp. TaxID=159447 RepID=UPI0025FE3B2D|nr:1,2-phenylacetyl-CoA epoxidase subunit PaaD [uncultured Corynebacterium sp.]